MGPRCSVPVAAVAVVLALVLFPFAAISGKRTAEWPEGRANPDLSGNPVSLVNPSSLLPSSGACTGFPSRLAISMEMANQIW
jgi:hypothetical protein